MLYRDFDRKALDAAYNNTEHVGQARRDQYVAGWTARSEAFRKAHTGRLDLRYGDGARQRLDIFPCGRAGAPSDRLLNDHENSDVSRVVRCAAAGNRQTERAKL